MTLPASGQLSMSQIAAEFGGSVPHSLSEYYRGGGLVPNTPGNAGIPTSGAISLSNFYGAGLQTDIIRIQVGQWAGGGAFTDFRGYDIGQYNTFGSIISGSLSGGRTLRTVIQALTTATSDYLIELMVAGYSSDPGQSDLLSLESNGATFLGSNATYSYFSATGRARWSWPNQAFPFEWIAPVQYDVEFSR